MGYKYITDNNLYEKQTYMYSEYKGMDFIEEYLNSRSDCLDDIQNIVGGGIETNICLHENLLMLREDLKAGKRDNEVWELINAYTKSFEVRKRIYTEYDADWKPLQGVGFEEYESYLVFAECLLLAYQHTKCLKYFNCLLKLDDTLISVQNRMEQHLRKHLGQILIQEMNIFNQLMVANGIS